MSDQHMMPINPESLGAPRGYSNGMVKRKVREVRIVATSVPTACM